MNKPDWKNKNDYPPTTGTTMCQWAFEFLRRNKGYQSDVDEYINICKSIVRDFNPFLIEDLSRKEIDDKFKLLDSDPRSNYYDPPLDQGETENEWLQRIHASGKLKGKITPLDIWYGRKWGLKKLLYPYTPYNFFNIRFIASASSAKIAGPASLRNIQNITTHHEQAYFIDYRYPLEPQLKAIKRYAASHRKWLIDNKEIKPFPNSRIRSNLYVSYLQCLDALDVEAAPAEIAKILCSDKDNNYPEYRGTKTINDWMDAAKSLRDYGYRYLPTIK